MTQHDSALSVRTRTRTTHTPFFHLPPMLLQQLLLLLPLVLLVVQASLPRKGEVQFAATLSGFNDILRARSTLEKVIVASTSAKTGDFQHNKTFKKHQVKAVLHYHGLRGCLGALVSNSVVLS